MGYILSHSKAPVGIWELAVPFQGSCVYMG
jgi:hypothetical protein